MTQHQIDIHSEAYYFDFFVVCVARDETRNGA